MTGAYSTNGIQFGAGQWIHQPAGYETVSLNAGPLTNGGKTMSGDVTDPACTTFTANKAS